MFFRDVGVAASGVAASGAAAFGAASGDGTIGVVPMASPFCVILLTTFEHV